MEQRRLRLGDIVDDYCPRERRVTNHAVVAMIEEGVKQTRCTTCDAEHPYKGGKAPRRKKKETPDALYKEVLAGITDNEATLASPVAAVAIPAPPLVVEPIPAAIPAPLQASAAALADDLEEIEEPEELVADDSAPVEEGPVHRQLIRATLPRLEGQKDERRPTDFTIRQPGAGRPNTNFRSDGARQRGAQGQGQGQGQYGNRPPGTGGRSAGPRPGGGQGRSGGAGRPQQGGGFRAAPPQGRGSGSGGGRKRSR
jgi:translation initiation factor IF-2